MQLQMRVAGHTYFGLAVRILAALSAHDLLSFRRKRALLRLELFPLLLGSKTRLHITLNDLLGNYELITFAVDSSLAWPALALEHGLVTCRKMELRVALARFAGITHNVLDMSRTFLLRKASHTRILIRNANRIRTSVWSASVTSLLVTCFICVISTFFLCLLLLR